MNERGPMLNEYLSVWDFAMLDFHGEPFSAQDFAVATGQTEDRSRDLLEQAWTAGRFDKVDNLYRSRKPTARLIETIAIVSEKA